MNIHWNDLYVLRGFCGGVVCCWIFYVLVEFLPTQINKTINEYTFDYNSIMVIIVCVVLVTLVTNIIHTEKKLL